MANEKQIKFSQTNKPHVPPLAERADRKSHPRTGRRDPIPLKENSARSGGGGDMIASDHSKSRSDEAAEVPASPERAEQVELLQQFCSVERSRAYLCQPWTRNGYTYATNGHIAVRVPALSSIPDFKNAPDASRLWKTEPTGAFIPAPRITFPKFVERQCLVCNGAGVFKDIDGEDECEACWGSGKTPEDRSASFACMTFAVRYLRKMWELPGLLLGPEVSIGDNPYFFRFNGGEGCVMQMRGHRGKHIDLKISLFTASGNPETEVAEIKSELSD